MEMVSEAINTANAVVLQVDDMANNPPHRAAGNLDSMFRRIMRQNKKMMDILSRQ